MRGSALLMAVAMMACSAVNPAPPGWRRTMQATEHNPRGAWISVRLRDGAVVQGELLAVDGEHIYVERAAKVVPVPRVDVTEVDVSAYDADNGSMVAWTMFGTLSTLSHGFFLVLSAPTWLLWGSATARSQDREGYLRWSRAPAIGQLRPWARFPQGLPEGFRP